MEERDITLSKTIIQENTDNFSPPQKNMEIPMVNLEFDESETFPTKNMLEQSKNPKINPFLQGGSIDHITIDGKDYVEGDIVKLGYKVYIEFPDRKTAVGRKKKPKDLYKARSKRKETMTVEDKDISEEEYNGENDIPEHGISSDLINENLDVVDLGVQQEIEEWKNEKNVDSVITHLKKGGYKEEIIEMFSTQNYPKFGGRFADIIKQYNELHSDSPIDLTEQRMSILSQAHRTFRTELKYEDYSYYKIVRAKDGTLILVPYVESKKSYMNILDEDIMPPPLFSKYKPSHPKIPIIPSFSGYVGNLKFGDCVEYDIIKSKSMSGLVLKINKSTLDIMDNDGKIHKNLAFNNIVNVEIHKKIPKIFKTYKPSISKKISVGSNVTIIDPEPKLGKYMTFGILINKKTSGRILGFNNEGFVINAMNSKDVITTSYQEADSLLTKIDCPKSEKINFLDLDPKELYDKKVGNFAREQVVRLLFELFSSDYLVDGGIYAENIYDNKELDELHKRIDWTLVKDTLLTWDEYYSSEFRKYSFRMYEPSIRQFSPSFMEEARKIANDYENPEILLDGLLERFGNNLLLGNAYDFINIIKNKVEKVNVSDKENILFEKYKPEIIDLHLISYFSVYNKDTLEKTNGNSFAQMLSRSIIDYYRKYPIKVSEINEKLKEAHIIKEFNTIIPTKELQQEFDSMYLGALQLEYNNYENKYKIEKEKENFYYEKKKNIEENFKQMQKDTNLLEEKYKKTRSERSGDNKIVASTKHLEGRTLSMKGLKLYEDIIILENHLYSLSNKTNLSYLRKVFGLVIFIDRETNPGKVAHFIKAKIKSNTYKVKNLYYASLPNLFPEFFANFKLNKEKFYTGLKLIKREINYYINSFVSVWLLNNTQKGLERNDVTVNWKDYIVDKLCKTSSRVKKDFKDLSGNKNNVGDYICDKKTDEEGEFFYECHAKMEEIPLDDAILCMSNGHLTCLSLNDILFALADVHRGINPINPHTGEQYTQEFLDRMEDRYGDLLMERSNTGLFNNDILQNNNVKQGDDMEYINKKFPHRKIHFNYSMKSVEDIFKDDLILLKNKSKGKGRLVLYFEDLGEIFGTSTYEKAVYTLDIIKSNTYINNIILKEYDINDENSYKLLDKLGFNKDLLPLLIFYDVNGNYLGNIKIRESTSVQPKVIIYFYDLLKVYNDKSLYDNAIEIFDKLKRKYGDIIDDKLLGSGIKHIYGGHEDSILLEKMGYSQIIHRFYDNNGVYMGDIRLNSKLGIQDDLDKYFIKNKEKIHKVDTSGSLNDEEEYIPMWKKVQQALKGDKDKKSKESDKKYPKKKLKTAKLSKAEKEFFNVYKQKEKKPPKIDKYIEDINSIESEDDF